MSKTPRTPRTPHTTRNPVVGFLVSHPNRGTKTHKDKKKAARVPTLRDIRNQLANSKGDDDGLSQ